MINDTSTSKDATYTRPALSPRLALANKIVLLAGQAHYYHSFHFSLF